MSGPLEELRAAHDAARHAHGTVQREYLGYEHHAVARFLAASGTGERPADEGEPEIQRLRSGLAFWDRSKADGVAQGDARNSLVGGATAVLARYRPERLAPTPPDAGTGTPSDDGRGAQSVLDRLRGLVWAEVARLEGPPQGKTGGWGSKHWAEGVNVARSVAARELRAALTDGPTPAAPSGTTGATTGDDDLLCRTPMCGHHAAFHVGSPGSRGQCVRYGCSCSCRAFTPTPPSTGAESRDDQ